MKGSVQVPVRTWISVLDSLNVCVHVVTRDTCRGHRVLPTHLIRIFCRLRAGCGQGMQPSSLTVQTLQSPLHH